VHGAGRPCLVVVSSSGYDALCRRGALVAPLAQRECVFVFAPDAALPPAGAGAGAVHMIDPAADGDGLVELLQSIGRHRRAAQIVSICEDESLPVLAARRSLGLPGLDEATALLFRDKLLMKAAVPAGLIATPAGCAAEDAAAVLALQAQGGRLLLKPRRGSGARGIEVLDTAGIKRLLQAVPAQRAQFLVERYVAGALLHLDAVVRGGRLLFSSLGRYEAPPLAYGAGAWAGTRFSNADTPVHARARQILLALLQAWFVQDGVFHWEFFDTGADLVFGEIAIRPPGGAVSQALCETFGVHLVEEHVRVQLGLDSALTGATGAIAHGACLFYLARQSGVFLGLSGADSAGSALAHVQVRAEPGQVFGAARHSADSLLAFCLRASSAERLAAAMRALKAGVELRLGELPAQV